MKSFQQYVSDIVKDVKEVDVTALSQALHSPCLVIDIREPGEWEQGVIPSAVCCPRGILESKIVGLLDNCSERKMAMPVFLYCRSGARSVLAAQSLQNMGVNRCYSVKGGYQAWQEAGLPLAELKDVTIC